MVVLSRLRALRERRGMTQEEVAELASTSPTTIVRAEQGKDVRPPTLKRIAKALGVPTEQLLADEVTAPIGDGTKD